MDSSCVILWATEMWRETG